MFVQDDQWFPVWLFWEPSRNVSFSIESEGHQFISFSRGCAWLEVQSVSTRNLDSSITIFIQRFDKFPCESIPQRTGFLQEDLVVIPLRCGPTEPLGRSGYERNGKECLSGSRSDRISTEQNLNWEAQNYSSKNQGTRASSWSWVVWRGEWGRTRWSCFFSFCWPALYWLAFLPRALLTPKCSVCFCNPQRSKPSLGGDPHLDLMEAGSISGEDTKAFQHDVSDGNGAFHSPRSFHFPIPVCLSTLNIVPSSETLLL